jgi:hypothetical protein
MLAAHETGGPALRPVVLASLLSWTYFVKPTYSVPIIGVSIYVLLFHRPRFPAYVATGVVWAAGFVAYSWYHFGALLPSYYYLASWMDVATLRRGLLVNLTSPSRGLLVYVPVLVFVVYVLVRYMRDLPLRRLVVLSACIVVGHLVAISGFPIWWAGFCYGPRFSTGLVPWFALFPIIAIAARQRSAALPSRWRTAELVVGGILLAASITLNGIGANVGRTAQWNVEPVSVDVQPERVLDWRDPQFLR